MAGAPALLEDEATLELQLREVGGLDTVWCTLPAVPGGVLAVPGTLVPGAEVLVAGVAREVVSRAGQAAEGMPRQPGVAAVRLRGTPSASVHVIRPTRPDDVDDAREVGWQAWFSCCPRVDPFEDALVRAEVDGASRADVVQAVPRSQLARLLVRRGLDMRAVRVRGRVRDIVGLSFGWHCREQPSATGWVESFAWQAAVPVEPGAPGATSVMGYALGAPAALAGRALDWVWQAELVLEVEDGTGAAQCRLKSPATEQALGWSWADRCFWGAAAARYGLLDQWGSRGYRGTYPLSAQIQPWSSGRDALDDDGEYDRDEDDDDDDDDDDDVDVDIDDDGHHSVSDTRDRVAAWGVAHGRLADPPKSLAQQALRALTTRGVGGGGEASWWRAGVAALEDARGALDCLRRDVEERLGVAAGGAALPGSTGEVDFCGHVAYFRSDPQKGIRLAGPSAAPPVTAEELWRLGAMAAVAVPGAGGAAAAAAAEAAEAAEATLAPVPLTVLDGEAGAGQSTLPWPTPVLLVEHAAPVRDEQE